MEKFTDFIVEKMIVGNIIKESERKIYIFGVGQGITFLLNILTTLFIGAIFGMLWQSVLFLAFYTPIRIYAGGYHAKTQFRCYSFSVLAVIAAMLYIMLLKNMLYINIAIFAISSEFLYLKAPVENRAKPLSQNEKNVFRKQTRIVVIIETIAFSIAFLFKWQYMESIISVAVLLAAFMLMLVFAEWGKHEK